MSEIVQENVWFSLAFDQFANTSSTRIPFDHHLLLGMVAPRGLFIIDNIGYDWLGPWSSWACAVAARTIYSAFGAEDSFGISQAPNHTHREFPDYQQGELSSFINRFLFNQEANTAIWETAGNASFPKDWYPWNTPKFNGGFHF